VVIQDKEDTKVSDPTLNQFGYKYLGDSLFERMIKRAKSEGWKWAYDQLFQQGRMHEDIVRFPSEEFYDGTLKTLQSSLIQLDYLQSPLMIHSLKAKSKLESLIYSHRMIFINTPINSQILSKTNEYEAILVGEIIRIFKELYTSEKIKWTGKTLGVITPYRAQIAKIKEVIRNIHLDDLPISVDTIERYQGSARDIVILSLCTNRLEQMESMISLSTEGIDRKLNVALTRARKHQIILGNQEILNNVDMYHDLFKYCKTIDYEKINVD
jgi:DNA replication ATP-dependent helicase Dna2